MSLEAYRKKRDFQRSPEPRGRRARRPGARATRRGAPERIFVVQQHAARSMHWDFRLELDGVLKSWAVPKGPSLVAGERRMAVQTEDHPLDYAEFEGVIPKGEYGGGTVLLWDRGLWQPLGDPGAGLAKGKLDFTLDGEKLRGRWHLIRFRPRARDGGRTSWLLIKGHDAAARKASSAPVVATEALSVSTGRDLGGIAHAADRTWSSRDRGRRGAPPAKARSGAPVPKGARPAKLRGALAPQLATLVDAAPDEEGWLHEIKYDGYRLLARVSDGAARLVSRNGHDWTARFPTLAAALLALPVEAALLDGEAIVVDARGRSEFQALQAALGRGGSPDAVQIALFDCLHLDGQDLREVPLVERKRILRGLLARGARGSPLRFSEHQIGRGAEFFAAACKAGLEGIVSKRLDAPYRSGRTRSWLKVRCSRRQEFVIAGYSEPRGSRVGLGALLLGAHDAAGALRYCGKVGTGFDDATLAALHARLERLERPRPALADAPRMRGVHWVAPRLVAEVAFTEWTREGRVRHPVFLGLREDKAGDEVQLEVPQRTKDAAPKRRAPARGGAPGRRVSAAGERDAIAGVPLSHPDRVYFPDVGITKRDLAEYYEAVAERALPGLAGRPLTLLRCPGGIAGQCFYQKHAHPSVPETVARVRIPGDREPYAMVTDLASLISLVQIGALELHVWGARADRLDRPDLVVLDLDPGPGVAWTRVRDTALALRASLAELDLVAFARATGGKGLHVVVPIARRSSWEDVKGFARGVALSLVQLAPDHYVAQASKARRQGRIFVDWIRNTPEATAIASYSVRARPGAPVAVPLAWKEVEKLAAPLHESPREVLRRLRRPDPWAGFEASRRPLARSAVRGAARGT